MKKIYIGADHRGFDLKEKIKEYLDFKDFDYEDLGNKKYEKNDDYPDFAKLVAEKVAVGSGRGILICGSGQGVCIVANKYDGIRAAVGINKEQIISSTADEDINILCLAADHIDEGKAIEIMEAWIHTSFSNEKRHIRRVNKIKKIEKTN